LPGAGRAVDVRWLVVGPRDVPGLQDQTVPGPYRAAVQLGLVLAAVPRVVGTGTGLSRRRRLAARHAAAARLARAEAERDRASDEERHRLARELHDVGAHHLTSAVVTAEAARRLGGSRPELTAEALETAARDGRETLSALRELVAVMRTEAEGEPHTWNGRIAELAAGVGGLGGPVETDLRADLPGGLGETVFAIVREALTNTLRHAPGAAVRVVVGHHGGLLEVTVDNAAPPDGGAPHASGAVRGLGSGRGADVEREARMPVEEFERIERAAPETVWLVVGRGTDGMVAVLSPP
ncbi:sensor histidine kinase, partial [Streptomyces chitinivorans]